MTQPEDGSPAWSRRLGSELDASDARASALVRPLTPEQLNWAPQPGAWSVGQCIEHLCAMNEVYVEPIAAALKDRCIGSVEDIRPGAFSRWFIRNYIDATDSRKKAPAPKQTTPGSHVDPAVLDRFVRSNARIREVIALARRYDVNRLRFRNPFLPVLRFTVGTGLEILSAHERRHLRQAERVRQAMPASGASTRESSASYSRS